MNKMRIDLDLLDKYAKYEKQYRYKIYRPTSLNWNINYKNRGLWARVSRTINKQGEAVKIIVIYYLSASRFNADLEKWLLGSNPTTS